MTLNDNEQINILFIPGFGGKKKELFKYNKIVNCSGLVF